MGNYTILGGFENPRRGRQAINLTTNAPKILDLKSTSEQIFSRKLPLGAPGCFKLHRFCTIWFIFVRCSRICLEMNSSKFFRTLSKFRKQRENHRPVFSSIKRELLGIFTSAVTTKKCIKSVMQVNRKCMQSCCLAN